MVHHHLLWLKSSLALGDQAESLGQYENMFRIDHFELEKNVLIEI
jgi:hypothetical protein